MQARAMLYWLARAGLCLAFIFSGFSKLFDFHAAIVEQARFGLYPPGLFAVITIFVQISGSTLVLFAHDRAAMVGALALAGFTLSATVVGHPFWHEDGALRFSDLNAFLEHFGLIGGFVLIALTETRATRSLVGP